MTSDGYLMVDEHGMGGDNWIDAPVHAFTRNDIRALNDQISGRQLSKFVTLEDAVGNL